MMMVRPWNCHGGKNVAAGVSGPPFLWLNAKASRDWAMAYLQALNGVWVTDTTIYSRWMPTLVTTPISNSIRLVRNKVPMFRSAQVLQQGECDVNWPLGRVLMSYFASVYVRLVTGMHVQDTTGRFRMLPPRYWKPSTWTGFSLKGYAFQIEMKFTAYKCGIQGCWGAHHLYQPRTGG